MKTFLVTGTTQNYVPKMVPYLKTVDKNSNFDENLLVCVDFKSKLENNSKNITTIFLPKEKIQAKSDNGCIQYGEFLSHSFFDQVSDDDIICFTDGDIIMQRSLTDDEMLLIKSIEDYDILMQFNSYPGESLEIEYGKLTPLISYRELDRQIGGIPNNFSVYNSGVIIAKKKAWKILLKEYLKLVNIIDKSFNNYARQQWLISYIAEKFLTPRLMPLALHTHFHAGPLKNSFFDKNDLYVDNTKVVFSHFAYPVSHFRYINKTDHFNFQKQYIM